MPGTASGVDRSERSWRSRDTVVLVVTVLLATWPPVFLTDASVTGSWPVVVVGASFAALAWRRRRRGRLSGLTTPGGKRYLYGVFAFYVTGWTMTAGVRHTLGDRSTTSAAIIVGVLAAATLVGGVVWSVGAPEH